MSKAACEPWGLKIHGRVWRRPLSLLSPDWRTAISFSFTIKRRISVRLMDIYVGAVLSLQTFAPVAMYIWMEETRFYRNTWPPPPRKTGNVTLSKRHWSPESTGVTGQSLPLSLPRQATTRDSQCCTGRCSSRTVTDSTVSNPPLSGEAPPGLPQESPSLLMAIQASKEINSIFQNTFTSVKFSPQQEKTTSWGVFQHLERRDSTPYIFMLIDVFCFRNVNLFKRSLLF